MVTKNSNMHLPYHCKRFILTKTKVFAKFQLFFWDYQNQTRVEHNISTPVFSREDLMVALRT